MAKLAKLFKPPQKVFSGYSDCNECKLSKQCAEYPELFYCEKCITPQPNCLERKIECVYFIDKKDEGNILL